MATLAGGAPMGAPVDSDVGSLPALPPQGAPVQDFLRAAAAHTQAVCAAVGAAAAALERARAAVAAAGPETQADEAPLTADAFLAAVADFVAAFAKAQADNAHGNKRPPKRQA